MDRYARQIVLPHVGAERQARLAAAGVLVVGAGGLGCPVLHYLAAAGVGHLCIVDEEAPMVAVASQAGFRCFTAVADFKAYVQPEVLAESGAT